MDLSLAQICGSYPKTKPLISRLFFRILCPTLTPTTRPTSLPWLGPTHASTAGSTGDTLSLMMIDMTGKTLSQGWATKLCPGCGKTGSICWQLAGWFNNLLKFSGILKLVERHPKNIPFQIHLHLRPEIRGQPRPAQRRLGPGAQVSKNKAEKIMKKIMKKKTLLQIGAVRGQWAVPVPGVHHPDHHTWHLAQCPGWDHESDDDDDQMIMMSWQSPAPVSWGPRACTCRWAPPSTSPASSGTRQSSPPRWESSCLSRCHAPPSRVTCQYPSPITKTIDRGRQLLSGCPMFSQ